MAQQEHKHSLWSDKDKNFLYDNWGDKPVNRIANKLNRSTTSVYRFAQRKKLGGAIFGGTYLTTIECANIIKVDQKTIISWIKTKQLKLSRQQTGRRKIYLIDPKDFKSFLRNNQDKWNATRLDEGIFNVNEDWLIEKLKVDSIPVNKKSNTSWTTKEELRLLELVDEGYMSKDIAKMLDRSYKSVQHKRENLLKKRKQQQ